MDKRRASRYKRRLQVSFWSQDDRNPRKGFTQNVSLNGMFVSTNTPFRPGTRVFLEIPSGQDKLVLQGEVRYSARVDPALHRIKPSGMGIRLLRVEEVMAGVLKLKQPGISEAESDDEEEAAEVEEGTQLEGSVFRVTFNTPHELANTYERDIKYGGLFVVATEPSEKDEKVVIEFDFGWDASRLVTVQALVVKKFAAAEGSSAGEAVSGMGVAFSDPPDVMLQFGSVLSSLNQVGPQDP